MWHYVDKETFTAKVVTSRSHNALLATLHSPNMSQLYLEIYCIGPSQAQNLRSSRRGVAQSLPQRHDTVLGKIAHPDLVKLQLQIPQELDSFRKLWLRHGSIQGKRSLAKTFPDWPTSQAGGFNHNQFVYLA